MKDRYYGVFLLAREGGAEPGAGAGTLDPAGAIADVHLLLLPPQVLQLAGLGRPPECAQAGAQPPEAEPRPAGPIFAIFFLRQDAGATAGHLAGAVEEDAGGGGGDRLDSQTVTKAM